MMIKTKFLFFSFIVFSISLLAQPQQGIINIPDSTSVDSTAIQMSDSLQVPVKRDTLKPLYYQGLSLTDALIESVDKETIDRSDYRYSGDLINQFPFGYHADLGSVGNPSEVYLFGLGFDNISFLSNGIEITNRYQNALDLNLLQSEDYDLIEIPSLSSGFFYNNRNNPVSINFINKNKVNIRPYSRIRFYQAPENEGGFDGKFSAYLFKRVNLSFGISNQSTDSRYLNSELSNWQFSSSIRYMPSNFLNIIGSYSFSNLNMDLNGGVNVNTTPTELFQNLQAEVNFIDRYHKSTTHNFSISSIVEIDSLSYTNLTFYYQYFLNEYRQNELSFDTTEVKIFNNNSYKTFGAHLQQRFDFSPFNIEILGNYERTDFDVVYANRISTQDRWSIGGKLSGSFLSGLITPSMFIKQSALDENGFFGWGCNVIFNPLSWLKFGFGISDYDRDVNNFITSQIIQSSNVQIVDASVMIDYSFFNLALKYFSIEQSTQPLGKVDDINNYLNQSEISDYNFATAKRNGLNLKLDINFWKLSLQTNSSIYFDESGLPSYTIPEQTSFGGLYYIDTLFNDNFDLKAGINYKFYGKRGFAHYDFQRMQNAYIDINGNPLSGFNSELFIDSNYQLDLFVAGTIRKRAIVYLVFENLLNEQYYLIPYYPIQPPGFRFGVTWEFLD